MLIRGTKKFVRCFPLHQGNATIGIDCDESQMVLGEEDAGVIDVMPVRGRVAVRPPLSPRVSIVA